MHTPVLPAVTAGLVLLFLAAPVNAAQITRSYVASNGNDANDCKLPTPCRTFAGAYLNTIAGGEIDVLDSDGYGALTINHALSIVNNGTGNAAMIPAVNGVGITIAAGANDAIILRGLTIDGQGNTGSIGIKFTAGGSLTVQDCVIRHMGGDGIDFAPTGASKLSLSDSAIDDNGDAGLYIDPTGIGYVHAALSRIETNGNNDGVYADGSPNVGSIFVSIADSTVANNGSVGLAAYVNATIVATRDVVTGNHIGLQTKYAGASLSIGESTVAGNTYGDDIQAGSNAYSFGTNQVVGNAAVWEALTPATLQ